MTKYKKYKPSGIEWIGEIPEHWEEKKIKYVLKVHSGNGFPNEEQGKLNGKYPFYKVSDINGDSIFVEKANNYVSEIIVLQHKWNIIPIKSVIAAKIGEALKKNHRKITTLECIIDNNCIGLEPKNIEFRYNYYYQTIIDYEWFSNPGAIPSLSTDKFLTFSIAISNSYKEQTQIVNYLDRKTAQIDNLIAKKQLLIKLLEEEKTAVINEAITKGINPNIKLKDSGIEWLGKIPEHWEVKKLKYVAQANPSNIDKKSKEDEEQVKLCNYIDVYKNDFIDNKIDFMVATASESQIAKFTLEKGDVISTKDSETPDDIGNAALVVDELTNVVCGYHLTHIKPTKVNGDFLFRFFQSRYLNSYFEVSANGVTRFGLGVDKFTSAQILLPQSVEQIEIVSHIQKETTRIKKTIETTKKLIELLKEYRTAVISEAVTGKIKVFED